MMSHNLLFLLFCSTVAEKTVSIDLCSKEHSSVRFYNPKNELTQNCGCERNCIRKCCKPGYVLGRKYCFKNTSEPFIVSMYANKTNPVYQVDEDYSMDNFIVGRLECSYFRLNYPEEEFYLQRDGRAWVPMYDEFFGNNEYCIDEMNGFTPFMCFPEFLDISPGREANVIGRYA